MKTKNFSNSKNVSPGVNSIQNSSSKKHNPESTFIQGATESKLDVSQFQHALHSNFSSHSKQKQLNYSKCKSQVSFAKSQKKSTKTMQSSTKKHSISRLLQEHRCQKHLSWFTLNEQYPFKPSISAQLPHSIYPQQADPISMEKKFERLIENLRKKHVDRFQEKMRKEKLQVQTTCTFIPNKEKVENSQHDLKIHQNLFNHAKEISIKQKLTEQAKIQSEKQALQKLQQQQHRRYEQSKKKWQRFLNIEANKEAYEKPIYQRVDKVNDEKKQLIQKLKAKYQHNLTSPVKKLKQYKSQQLVKRLVDDYREEKKINDEKIEEKMKKEFVKTCPFTPVVHQTDLHREIDPDRFKEELKRSYRGQGKFTFVPTINDVSRIIASKLQNSNPRYYQQIGQRLCYPNNDQKQQKLQLIESEIYKQCSFRPQINQLSKDLIVYKHNQINGQQIPLHKCPLPETIIREQEQLTFQPQINLKSKCMSIVQKEGLLMKNHVKSREKLSKIQNQRQYNEMKECTFQPKTVSSSPDWKRWKQSNLKKQKMLLVPKQNILYSDRQNPQNPQTVRGLSQFMKNCQMIKRKKQDHEERLSKIFNYAQQYDSRMRRQKSLSG